MAAGTPLKLSSGEIQQFQSGDFVAATFGGTGLTSYVAGDLIQGTGVNTLGKLASVAVGSYLRSGGVTTASVWSTLTLPNTVANGNMLYATGTNAIGSISRFNIDGSNIFNINTASDGTGTVFSFNGSGGNARGLIRIFAPALGVGIGYLSGNSLPLYFGTDNTTWATFKAGKFYIGAAVAATHALDVDGDIGLVTAGNGFYIKEGTNATSGIATLSGGTVTVSTTKVTANSRIQITIQGGTLTNVGSTYISARTAGTSFVITSTNILDASTVAWVIIEPA